MHSAAASTPNPAAVIKSIEEQYKYLLASGVQDAEAYYSLGAQMNDWVAKWNRDVETGRGIALMGPDYARDIINYSASIGTRIQSTAEVSMTAASGRSRGGSWSGDYLLGEPPNAGVTRAKLTAELTELTKNGMPLEDAVRIMMESGRYSLSEVQSVAYRVGDPNYDMPGFLEDHPELTQPGEGEMDLPFEPGEGEGEFEKFKPREDIAADRTSPEDEFGKAFAQFTRQLEQQLGGGKAPQIGALGARYQDIFNKYLGEIENRKARGEEPADVFKDKFVNIGKSTDPQWDQETDRMQLQTVRPTLSAFDFLLQNIDPEDVYASTEFQDRPGRSTGGFRGFVRSLSR